MDIQTIYQETIKFATAKHLEQNQKIPGTELPYVVHLSNVAMEILIASFNTKEFNVNFAIKVALLHDTLEDTSTSFEELTDLYGIDVAHAVAALTKNNDLPKEDRMMDSLGRIKKLSKEVWAVKLADRITNLQKPPAAWDADKRLKYKKEALLILIELAEGNAYLSKRLKEKITEYDQYIQEV